MTNHEPRITERHLDDMLGRVRDRAWPGPDHSPRVDRFLSENAMTTQRKPSISRTTLFIAIAGALGGGAVAAAVTHQVMSQRAVLIADDGTEYQVELLPTPEGAAGTFVTDDGSVYGINMVEEGATERSVTVDIDSTTGGTSTILLPDGASPSITTAPGEPASFTINGKAPTGATFIDENGESHEVDPSAVDGWVSSEKADEKSDG